MKSLLILMFALLTLNIDRVHSQVLDEETGFVYVKAEYLYETGRFEEAITNYNVVISKDPKYKEALIHRGLAKYALAAYKGAKMDAIQSIDLKGITADASALLGRSFSAMNDQDAGIHCLTAAIALDVKNSQFYEWRAGMYENKDQILKACADYETAMNMGSQSAEIKARNLCGLSKSKPKPNPSPDSEVVHHPNPANNENQQGKDNNNDTLGDNEVLSSGAHEQGTQPQGTGHPGQIQTSTDSTRIVDDSDPAVVDENLPKNDDTVNSFVIDDDLTISVSGQELGKRTIREIPSILILADENGKVTLNICVNKEGVVTKAEFNGSMSTIAKKSLVSLALRKAKEFEFAPGKYDLQCGLMVFNIKGS